MKGNGIDLDRQLSEIYGRLNLLGEKQSQAVDRIDNIEGFMQTLSQTMSTLVSKLEVLEDIKNEIHSLKDSLVKPLIKVITVMILGMGALLIIVVGVAIGIKDFHASPSEGVSFGTHAQPK